jgi:hypothetical protein
MQEADNEQHLRSVRGRFRRYLRLPRCRHVLRLEGDGREQPQEGKI